MAVDIAEIKRLRELTGVGMTDAKKALDEVGGDFDKALEAMRKKGLTKAEKKGEREAREGLVDSYVHSGRIGVIVEVNCETDFVTKTDDFKALVHDVALQISASAPEYVSVDDVPADVRFRGWVFLAWGGDIAVESIRVGDRLPRLAQHLGLRVPPSRPDRLLELAALPSWEFRRPRGWDRFDEAGSRLLDALAG